MGEAKKILKAESKEKLDKMMKQFQKDLPVLLSITEKIRALSKGK